MTNEQINANALIEELLDIIKKLNFEYAVVQLKNKELQNKLNHSVNNVNSQCECESQ